MIVRRSLQLFLGFATLFLLSVRSPGATQIIVLADPVAGAATFHESDGTLLATVPGFGFVTHVVGNGVGRAWLLESGTGTVHLADEKTGLVRSLLFGHYLSDMAMTHDGGAVLVGHTSLWPEDRLIRVGSGGDTLWEVPIPASVTSVCVDELGRVYTTHGIGFSAGILSKWDSEGRLMSQVGTGLGPTGVSVDGDNRVWVVCGGGDQLVVHTDSGAVITSPLPSGVADMALDFRGRLALSRPGENEVLILDDSGSFTLPVSGGPNGLAWKGAGGLLAACSVSGGVVWSGIGGGSGAYVVLAHSLICRGDMTGYEWAGSAGRGEDSDVDGFSNGEEIAAGSDPFDSAAVPMGIKWDPLIPGILRLSSLGTQGAFYFMALSHGRTGRAQGHAGLSLGSDPVTMLSLHSSVFFGSPLGAFDGQGQASKLIDLAALAVVEPVWAGFVAYPDFPDLGVSVASPAVRLRLP